MKEFITPEHEKYLRWSRANLRSLPASTPGPIFYDLMKLGLAFESGQLSDMGNYVAGLLSCNEDLEELLKYRRISGGYK